MKNFIRFFAFCIAFCNCNYLWGQHLDASSLMKYDFINKPGATLYDIIDSMVAHANQKDTAEGGEMDQIMEFKKLWEKRVWANDKSGVNMFQQYNNTLITAAAARVKSPVAKGTSATGSCSGGLYQGDWTAIGPDNFSQQVAGYVTCIWADPGTSGHILAGTYGGLFQSTDDGASWNCITDNSVLAGPSMHINSIAVDPTNANNIFLGTSGADILESTNGGVTWTQDVIVSPGESIGKIFITPSGSRMYAFYNNTVYTRTLPTGSWLAITSVGSSGWWDLQFVPSNPNHFFISGSGKFSTGIWEATDPIASTGWTDITSSFSGNICGNTTIELGLLVITMSLPGSDTLFFAAMDTFENAALFKYNITGSSHTITEINSCLPGTDPGRYKLIVSPGNYNNMYYAGYIPYAAHDRTSGFSAIGRYSANPTHGDIRDMSLQAYSSAANGTGDRLYLGDDGGASEKKTGVNFVTSGDLATVDVSGKGLNCGTYWDFMISEKDAGMGGMMHCGMMAYEPEFSQPWKNLLVCDAWESEVDRSAAYPTTGYSYESFWGDVLHESYPSLPTQLAGVSTVSGSPIAYDPGFGGVGETLGSDAFGTFYNIGRTLSRKRTIDPGFSDVSSLTGFPNTISWPHPYYGAAMAINTNNSDFEGYILYNTNTAPYQHIWYRHSTVYGPAFEVPGSFSTTIPGMSNHMNGITTNINNTENVWVSLSGTIWSSYPHTRYRVVFSPDHGTTWVDISNGLPQLLPAGAIVYDEVANMVYVSTDVGVYKCDFSAYNPAYNYTNSDGYLENDGIQWTCFNQGAVAGKNFPNLAAGTLQINHCEGKIYAAMFGRSVWSSDLNPPGTVVPVTTVITSTTPNWSSDHTFTGSIDIQAGSNFFITGCTVHMPRGGVIIVEPGAHLTLNAATLTNDCYNSFWQGVQVRGNTGLPQYAANQGWITIEGGSVIENALIGVANCNTDPAYTFGSTGGIIQAWNSSFIDNQNDVTFHVYDNWHGSYLYPNISHFNYCTFLLDNNYKGNSMGTAYRMNNMAYLSGVEGVNFVSCNFLNRDTNPSNQGLGEGIHAHNSGFYVSPSCAPGSLCLTPYIRSRFCGFTNSIMVESTTTSWAPTVSIDMADFDSTSVGVNILVANSTSTTRCNFNVGHGLGVIDVHSTDFTGCYQNIGYLLQGSPLFRLEGNTFVGFPNLSVSNWYNFGAVVANTGYDHDNTIYRNTFGNNLTFGAFSLGCNKSFSGTDGLEVQCNAFQNNTDDIFSANDGNLTYMQGLAIAQGFTAFPAANTFTGSTHNIVLNTNWGLDYFYNVFGLPTEEPYDYLSGLYLSSIWGTVGTNSCPSSFSPYAHYTTANTLAQIAANKTLFLNSQTTLQNTSAMYNSQIDFGNTTALVNTIINSSNPQSLYQTLSGGSPFISQTALEAVGDNMKLPYNMIMPLMQQNPDDLRDGNFISHMQTDYQLTANDVATLQAAAQNTTNRTGMETTMSQSKATMANESNNILMALKSPIDPMVDPQDPYGAGICMDSTNIYYLLDSNSYYPWLDSVDTMLQTDGSYWTNYARIGYYNWRYGPQAAGMMLQSMSNLVPQIPLDQQEYATYNSLWNVVLNAEMNGRSQYQLNPSELSTLSSIGGTSYSFTANTGVLTAYSLSHFSGPPVPVYPGPFCLYVAVLSYKDGTSNAHNNANAYGNLKNLSTTGGNTSVSIYPNPAQENVTIALSSGQWGSGALIRVYDVSGKEVNTFVPNAEGNDYHIDISKWIGGVYMINVQQSNGDIVSKMLIVERQ